MHALNWRHCTKDRAQSGGGALGKSLSAQVDEALGGSGGGPCVLGTLCAWHSMSIEIDASNM